MIDPLPDRARKGRGAVSNREGRFESADRVATDDGWGGAEAEPEPLRTVVGVDATRKILARNDSPDVPFDRSINPYRGCEHGCVYCFARPTHAFLGLSPGLDFESRIFAKPEAASLLEAELRRPAYSPDVIAIGANTDPYQPIERERRITRGILEVLAEYNHPVSIVTKSDLVLRDIDILAPMAERGLASVLVSVTTLDGCLARLMEPRAPRPDKRLAAIRGLSAAGIPVGVLSAPMIPGLNDWELERLLQAASEAGAGVAGYVLLRLPLEIKELFEEWLAEHYPDRAGKVLSLMRQTRNGGLYDAQFGKRMRGEGPYAALLKQRFDKACVKFGLDTSRQRFQLDTSQFARPPRSGDQLSLL